MNKQKKQPDQIVDLKEKILWCIEHERYIQSKHAIERGEERQIDLPDVLYVLKHGYHEKKKTRFHEIHNTWNYAIRGKTLDGIEIRVIVAFDENDMLIITVICLENII